MSKFDGILSVKNDGDATKKNKSKAKPAETGAVDNSAAREQQSKRLGKRSHPDFTQITAYIKKSTHEDVMRKIYKRQEFSELLEELLSDWLKKT